MRLTDPAKMAAARAKAGRGFARIFGALILAAVPIAYGLGHETARVEAINVNCATWTAGRP